MKRAFWSYCVMVMLLLLTAVPLRVRAQAGGEDSNQCPPNCPNQHRGKMAANYENLRLLKLLETVDLSEAQSETFIPLFQRFRKDIRQLHQERKDILDQLRLMFDETDNEAKISEKLDQLRENQNRVMRRQHEFLEDCGEVLDIRQLARLVVFQDMFEREVLESLREFRGMGMAPRSNGKR